MSPRSTESVGDVFQDIGFSVSEAEELRLRSDLMIQVQELVRSMPGSQVSIARRLGVSQPRVSDLLRGKLHLFSLDSLTQMLTRVGAQVRITVDDFPIEEYCTVSVSESWSARQHSIGYSEPAEERQTASDTQLALAA